MFIPPRLLVSSSLFSSQDCSVCMVVSSRSCLCSRFLVPLTCSVCSRRYSHLIPRIWCIPLHPAWSQKSITQHRTSYQVQVPVELLGHAPSSDRGCLSWVLLPRAAGPSTASQSLTALSTGSAPHLPMSFSPRLFFPLVFCACTETCHWPQSWRELALWVFAFARLQVHHEIPDFFKTSQKFGAWICQVWKKKRGSLKSAVFRICAFWKLFSATYCWPSFFRLLHSWNKACIWQMAMNVPLPWLSEGEGWPSLLWP